MPLATDRSRTQRTLDRGQAVELDWGLVLHPPSEPGARGANGSYRWVYYDPPVREDGKRGERTQRTARQLDDRAWVRIETTLRDLEATMLAQATGSRLDASFGDAAEHWEDPSRHPDWTEGYTKKIQSVTRNWLLADGITVQLLRKGRTVAVPLREVLLAELTAPLLIEALAHVREQRAYGTYRTAHECVTGIIGWAVTIKWLPVGHVAVDDIKRAPDPRVGARRNGARGNLTPVPKDDIPALDRLLDFHRWIGERSGREDRILMDVLAFSGPRIGEALAFCPDRFHRDDEGNGWMAVEERAHKTKKKQEPPKHNKHRDVWIPAWLAEDLETVEPNLDGYYWGAHEGSTWPVDRWRERRFDRWAEAYGWPELDDYCRHGDAPACRGEARCTGQNRRRWRHSIHDWRHAAAVWQLFELRLDPEDVAQHLGHGDGYTLYQLYIGARPGRPQRAARAVAEAGDPRLASGFPSAASGSVDGPAAHG